MLKFLASVSFVAALAGGSVAPAFAQTPTPAPASTLTCATGDAVVWENTKSKVYHVAGDKYFGTTAHGKYACKSAADAAGYHAAGSTASGKKATSSPAPSGTAVPSPVAPNMPTAAPKHHHHHHNMATPSPAPTAT